MQSELLQGDEPTNSRWRPRRCARPYMLWLGSYPSVPSRLIAARQVGGVPPQLIHLLFPPLVGKKRQGLAQLHIS